MIYSINISGSLFFKYQYVRFLSINSINDDSAGKTSRIGFDTNPSLSKTKKEEEIEPLIESEKNNKPKENGLDPKNNQVEFQDSPTDQVEFQDSPKNSVDLNKSDSKLDDEQPSGDSNPYSDKELEEDQRSDFSNIPKNNVDSQSGARNANQLVQNNEKPFEDVESSVIFDKLITPDEAANLSILYESDELFEHSQNVFNKNVELRDKCKIADADYSHFKNKDNAIILKGFDNILVPYWKNWHIPRMIYTEDIVDLITSCNPLPNKYLKDLTRAVWKSPNLTDSPVWSLAPYVPHAMGNILYSASLGVGDLMYFMPSKYTKLVFTLEYDSTIPGTSGRPFDKKNKVSLTLSNGDNISDFNLTVNLESKLFDLSTLKPTYKLFNKRSMFSSDTYSSIISEMFTPELNEVSSKFSQTTVSDRVGIYIKGNDSQTFGDAFLIHTLVNDNHHLDIYDKSIVDMLISLLYCDEISSDEEYLKMASNYIATTIHRYFVDGMVVRAGVNMHSLTFKFSTTRNRGFTTADDLRQAFVNYVESGKLIPVSTLQMQQYINASNALCLDKRWLSKSVFLNLANVNINDPIIDFLPKCSISYKGYLKQLMRHDFMRQSDHYITDVVLPWQNEFKCEISKNDIYREMLVRSFLRDEVPDYIPLFTRGGWRGTSGTSFNIDIPSHHRVAKYTLPDTEDAILSLCNSALFETHPRKYIKRTARLTRDIPPVFKHILDGDS